MVTGPDGSERLLLTEIEERKMREDPEKYKVESWSYEIIIIIIMIIMTSIGLIYIFSTKLDIWFTLALLGNLIWATIATIYVKKRHIKHYKLLHPEKYD